MASLTELVSKAREKLVRCWGRYVAAESLYRGSKRFFELPSFKEKLKECQDIEYRVRVAKTPGGPDARTEFRYCADPYTYALVLVFGDSETSKVKKEYEQAIAEAEGAISESELERILKKMQNKEQAFSLDKLDFKTASVEEKAEVFLDLVRLKQAYGDALTYRAIYEWLNTSDFALSTFRYYIREGESQLEQEQ